MRDQLQDIKSLSSDDDIHQEFDDTNSVQQSSVCKEQNVALPHCIPDFQPATPAAAGHKRPSNGGVVNRLQHRLPNKVDKIGEKNETNISAISCRSVKLAL